MLTVLIYCNLFTHYYRRGTMGKLRLYQVDFEPSDNFYIEDIESYLKTLPSTAKREEWNNLNYLKLGMNLTIRLPLNQVHQIENTCNYAIIEQDGNTYYYFVVNARWVAKKTVELVLTLDTVQTFFPKLKWSDKTQIIRETQDRLVKLNTNYYLRKIDKYNEGFNPAKVQKVNETTINSSLGGKWYLIYMSNPATTQDKTGNPLFMGLLGTTSYKIANAGTGTNDITITLEDDKIYMITDSSVGEGASITFSYYATSLTRTVKFGETSSNKRVRAVKFGKNYPGLDYNDYKLWYTGDTYPYSFSEESNIGGGQTPIKVVLHNIRTIHVVPRTDYYASITSIDKMDPLPATQVNAGTFPALSTTPYRDFDNSNSRLSKIIELPYAPVSITKNADGTYNFDGCTFNYGYNIMQVNTDRLSTNVKEDTRLQDLLYITITNPTPTDKPNINLESKLYSSEFYDYAYYYDTDKQPIRLEDITTNMLNCSINIYYNTTTTMNSDKQFYFAMHNATYNEMQPYEMYLNCARSTEKMILNDSYAEYVKNGYNYDLWNQKRQEKIATTNAIISGIQAGVGILGSATTVGANINAALSPVRAAKKYIQQADARVGGALFDALPGPREAAHPDAMETKHEIENLSSALQESQQARTDITLAKTNAKSDIYNSISGIGNLVFNQGISAVNSMVNSAMSIESSQRNFSNAINSRANTPIGASGNVPTDLFDNYSSNKLTRYEYTMRADERTNLFNTFRLTGYSHPVQEKPVFNTRIYSNFVQCKPVFLNSLTEIYKVYLDDISLRFQAGITVKHNYKGKYDLYDEYENYETIVMEE